MRNIRVRSLVDIKEQCGSFDLANILPTSLDHFPVTQLSGNGLECNGELVDGNEGDQDIAGLPRYVELQLPFCPGDADSYIGGESRDILGAVTCDGIAQARMCENGIIICPNRDMDASASQLLPWRTNVGCCLKTCLLTDCQTSCLAFTKLTTN